MACVHIKFDGFQLHVYTWEFSTIFTIYAVLHRESNEVCRFCKSFTIMKIRTYYNMTRCILCTYISPVFSCQVTYSQVRIYILSLVRLSQLCIMLRITGWQKHQYSSCQHKRQTLGAKHTLPTGIDIVEVVVDFK